MTAEDHAADPVAYEPLVDFGQLGRRLGVSAAVLGGLAVLGWLVSVVAWGFDLGRLFGYLGFAVLGMFVVEVVVVGGAALRAMLRAGERGHRLASGDVGILPPQLTRRPRS